MVLYQGFCFVHSFSRMLVKLGQCLIYLGGPRVQYGNWHAVGMYSVFGNQILKEKKMRMTETKEKRGISSFSQQWESAYYIPGLWPREPWEG